MTRRLIAVAAMAVLVAGCGAVEDEPPDLAVAADRTEATKSSRIEVYGEERADGKSMPATCVGAADYAAKRLDVSCEYGNAVTFEMRAISGTTYIRDEGEREKWQKFTDDNEDPVGELSPERLLAMLRGASRDTEHVGEDVVRRVPVVRYRLTVDCDEAELTDCPGGTAPVDVWIGEDDIVRRIHLEDGGFDGTMEFFDFGVDVDVQPPPADQVEVVEELTRPRPCQPERGSPIRGSQALAALRRAGFTVTIRRNECFVDTVAVLESEDLGSPDVAGGLMCEVFDKPTEDSTKMVVRRVPEEGIIDLSLQNVQCVVFADDGPGDEAADRLEAALGELERAKR